MPEEKSIQNQIAAMESWAIDTRNKIGAGNYNDAEADLKNINLQGRRLEWRRGKLGLKHLPDLDEVKKLKKKITSARAAAQFALTSITNLSKLLKQKGKTPAEVAAIEKKENSLKKDAGKNTTILIRVLEEARGIAVNLKESLMNLDNLSKNRKNLELFLGGKGYYEGVSSVERVTLWNKWWQPRKVNLRNLNLKGASLSGIMLNAAFLFETKFNGADLTRAVLAGSNLTGADLSKSKLIGANLGGVDLSEANLKGADLSGANLGGANLTKANLTEVDLNGANLGEADLNKTDLNGVKNLTADQFRLTRNKNKAINVPELL